MRHPDRKVLFLFHREPKNAAIQADIIKVLVKHCRKNGLKASARRHDKVWFQVNVSWGVLAAALLLGGCLPPQNGRLSANVTQGPALKVYNTIFMYHGIGAYDFNEEVTFPMHKKASFRFLVDVELVSGQASPCPMDGPPLCYETIEVIGRNKDGVEKTYHLFSEKLVFRIREFRAVTLPGWLPDEIGPGPAKIVVQIRKGKQNLLVRTLKVDIINE